MSTSPMKPRSIGCSATYTYLLEKCYGLDIIVDDSIEAQPEILWKLAITRRCFIWVTRSLRD